MLEIRNITKVYHSKAGNSVRALDNISVTFPETGMVFILGKSGSGKSTLLNVIGGLDGYDSGEFIIKGKSSKDFAGSDFDAYRNTFIGFIFQEYNILDDFTVGANIGLALELQGKKATGEKISEILTQVEMLEYAKRKPNELSGGQKQRIAIARALVKDPEIIMADEPTGALDSNTGKQIFDTLKELSKNKLVIIVSHDRDFAEKYGDRIIEMKDGRIFSDVTKHEVEAKAISSGILQMNGNLLRIEQGYQLTADDLALINDYLKNQKADILISGDRRLNDTVRSAAGISADNRSSSFDDTDVQKDIVTKDYSAAHTKFIRSRLPLKNALKMGGNSLGHKKFRLVMTIFLSLIAFALFGFADSLGAYDKITAATDSIIDSHVQNASFTLGVKHTYQFNDGDSYSYYSSTAMNDADLQTLKNKTGINFIPVFNGSQEAQNGSISLVGDMLSPSSISSSETAYTASLYGMTAAGTEQMNQLGFTVYGTMPTQSNEIAISKFMAEQFNFTGFQNTKKGEKIAAGSVTYSDDGSVNSLIGKHLSFAVNGYDYLMTITAVIDTDFEYDRYASFIPTDDSSKNNTEIPEEDAGIMDMILTAELKNTLRYGFHCLGYITQETMDSMAERIQTYGNQNAIGTSMNWMSGLRNRNNSENSGFTLSLDFVADSSALSAVGDIQWLDGVSRTALGANEMVVSSSIFSQMTLYANTTETVNRWLEEYFGGIESFDAWFEQSVEFRENDVLFSISSNNWHVYRYILQNFDANRSALETAYRREHTLNSSWSEAETKRVLTEFWAETILYNSEPLLPNDPVTQEAREELLLAAYRSLFNRLFETTFSESLPLEFYQGISNFFNQSENNGTVGYFLASYNIHQLLMYKHAYELLWNNDSLCSSQDFFDQVLSSSLTESEWKNQTYSKNDLVQAYIQFLYQTQWNGSNNPFGKTYSELQAEASALFFKVADFSMTDAVADLYLSVSTYEDGTEQVRDYPQYTIAGVFSDPSGNRSTLVISDTLYEAYEDWRIEQGYGKETVAAHTPGIYAFAIAPMPTDREAIQKLVELSYDEDSDLAFTLKNQVMDTLGSFNDFIETGAKIFLYIGIGFAVFSALMLMNFISISISYKRREIGILRAVGARSSDVFKIFFCEAFIIALINYILAMIAAISATNLFNTVVREQGINVTLLHFGIRQVILMFFISTLVAAAASFLPVWNIARRKPVDAIKNK